MALLAAHYGGVFLLLKPKAWLNDGLHQAERDVLFALLEVAEADEGVAQDIAAMPFWGTLEPQSDVTTLKDLAELAQKKPGLFDHLSGQTWVTDGLTPTERLFVEL